MVVLKPFFLMLVAALIIVITAVPILIAQVIRHCIMRKPLAELWWSVAIGLDQLGGSILYCEPDWTVSSRTYWLRSKGNRYAAWFEKFINVLFGESHCEESYKKEFGNIKEK